MMTHMQAVDATVKLQGLGSKERVERFPRRLLGRNSKESIQGLDEFLHLLTEFSIDFWKKDRWRLELALRPGKQTAESDGADVVFKEEARLPAHLHLPERNLEAAAQVGDHFHGLHLSPPGGRVVVDPPDAADEMLQTFQLS